MVYGIARLLNDQKETPGIIQDIEMDESIYTKTKKIYT